MADPDPSAPPADSPATFYGPDRRRIVFWRDIAPWAFVVLQLLGFIFALGVLWETVRADGARIDRLEQNFMQYVTRPGGR